MPSERPLRPKATHWWTPACCVLGLGLGVLTSSPAPAETFEIQPEKSRLRFEVGHHDYAKPVRGRFEALSGAIHRDPEKDGELRVDVEITASSIDTDNAYRDEHLRAAFFEVEDHPSIRFSAAGFRADGETKPLEVTGNLTMKGITRPIVLQVSGARELVDKDGNRVLRCRVKGSVNRRDFDVQETSAEEAQGLSKILAHIQEGLDEFIEDEVEFSVSVVAREDANSGDAVASAAPAVEALPN
ncbi:MAG: YceI family protein [Myxococcota bacterium]